MNLITYMIIITHYGQDRKRDRDVRLQDCMLKKIIREYILERITIHPNVRICGILPKCTFFQGPWAHLYLGLIHGLFPCLAGYLLLSHMPTFDWIAVETMVFAAEMMVIPMFDELWKETVELPLMSKIH